jgi:hypothetical protein
MIFEILLSAVSSQLYRDAAVEGTTKFAGHQPFESRHSTELLKADG